MICVALCSDHACVYEGVVATLAAVLTAGESDFTLTQKQLQLK